MHNDGDLLLADRVEKAMLAEMAQMAARGQTRLPQQAELTGRHGVSIQTIRTVVARLKARHLIRSVKGKGMFLVPGERGTGNVIVLAENFSSPYSSTATALAGDLLLKQGFTPVMSSSRDLPARAKDALGILVIESSPEAEAFLVRGEIPFCGVNDVFDKPLEQPLRFQTVRCNSYRWGLLAAAAALAAGKRNLLLFSGPPTLGYERLKRQGCLDALRLHGLDATCVNAFTVPADADASHETFCKEVRTALKHGNGRTGIIDFDGQVLSQGSPLYEKLFQSLPDPAHAVAVRFSEMPKLVAAGTRVMVPLAPLIGRALEIVLGRTSPIALCETLDNFQASIKKEGQWRDFDPLSLLAPTGRAGTP